MLWQRASTLAVLLSEHAACSYSLRQQAWQLAAAHKDMRCNAQVPVLRAHGTEARSASMSSSSCSRRPPCSDTPAASPALYAAAAASHMSPASFVSTCSACGVPLAELSFQNPDHICSAAGNHDQPCAGNALQRWLTLQLSREDRACTWRPTSARSYR
jgi:hypothetical protein